MEEREFIDSIRELGLMLVRCPDGEKAIGHPEFANPLLWFNDTETYRGSVTVKSINHSLYTDRQILYSIELVDNYLGGR